MTTTERLLQFVEYKGISKYEFHKKNGLSNGFLDKSRAIGTDKCARILENYPEINPEWLITGEGEMIRTSNKKRSQEKDLNKDIEKALKSKNKEEILKNVLLNYYLESPEKLKDFDTELSEEKYHIENIMSLQMRLLGLSCSVADDEKGKRIYEFIKKNFPEYIENTIKISKYLKIDFDVKSLIEEAINE